MKHPEDEIIERGIAQLRRRLFPADGLHSTLTRLGLDEEVRESEPLRCSPKSLPFRRRVLIGAIVLIGIFLYPFTPPHLGLVQRVQAAGAGVHTWHAEGWRIWYGKKVRHEIWWRSEPFFLREQTGEDVLIDDGIRRLHIRPDIGIATIGLSERTAPPGPWTGFVRQGELVAEDARQVTVRDTLWKEVGPDWSEPNTRDTWTLSKESWLPIAYTEERGYEENWQGVRSVRYDYGRPVPEWAMRAVIPPGLTVMDYSEGGVATDPETLAQTINDLRIQIMSIAQGEGGVVLVEVGAWLGGKPLAGEGSPHTDYSVWARQIQEISGRPDKELFVHDDQGRPYLFAEAGAPVNALEMEQRPKRYLLFPLYPFGEGETAPRLIELPLRASAFVSEKLSGSDSWSARRKVHTASYHFQLRLPPAAATGALANRVRAKKGGADAWLAAVSGYMAEERSIALQRLKQYEAAAVQMEEAMRLRPGPPWGDSRKLTLAKLYRETGEKERAVSLLRDFLKRDLPKMIPPPAKKQVEEEARRLLLEMTGN